MILIKYQQLKENIRSSFQFYKIVLTITSNTILITDGFHNEIDIQNFPYQDSSVFLRIKRQRWIE